MVVRKQAPKTASANAVRRRSATTTTPRRARTAHHDHDSYEESTDDEARSSKRQKVSNPRTNKTAFLPSRIFQADSPTVQEPCSPATGRRHALAYHKPLFLCQTHGRQYRRSLLEWFDSVSTSRSMPWRKAWINPRTADASLLRKQLERRAYEVWISEIMLQQTRVAVVIDYWNKWMEKWPTIQHLAGAESDDVLAAWRGLGYYSRATRIHQASKLVVQDAVMQGLLPSTTRELEAQVPGVGRYTAGAISAIVFGRPAPMVDGNVLRVLSRQLGIHGNIKSDKKVIDTIWAAADALVQAVASDGHDQHDSDVSDRPGRWGQALMELGSTVCTPKPNCSKCPVTASCRAYSEAGTLRMTHPQAGSDIEDLCTLCEPFEDIQDDSELAPLRHPKSPQSHRAQRPKAKQMTLSDFAFTGKPTRPSPPDNPPAYEAISAYARRFPVKTLKKAVRAEETLVCAIRHLGGTYLIHRRPQKGLLAGLWEFPSKIIPPEFTDAQRADLAEEFVRSLFEGAKVKRVADLGAVPWLFSHIRLTMHVYVFDLLGEFKCLLGTDAQPARWTAEVETESMGTGMRKCWALVKKVGK